MSTVHVASGRRLPPALWPLVLGGLLPACLAAEPLPGLAIELLLPASGAGEVVVFPGGWPLTLRLSVPADEVCLGRLGEERSFLVFGRDCEDEVDGEADPFPADHAIEFTPDSDLPGTEDAAGNRERRAALTGFSERGPRVPTFFTFQLFGAFFGLFLPAPIGPFTGGEVLDGYGYGADDDLPGLVLIADRGMSPVLGRGLDPLRPARVRNLAGLLDTVSLEPRGPDGRTAILAHMVVPPRLLSPLLLVDECAGLHRADGGPLAAGLPTEAEIAAPVTLRAFLVAGVAPAVLADADADGVVDTRDAELSGYRLLSPEASLRLRTAGAPGGQDQDEPFTSAVLDYDRRSLACRSHLKKRASLIKIPR